MTFPTFQLFRSWLKMTAPLNIQLMSLMFVVSQDPIGLLNW